MKNKSLPTQKGKFDHDIDRLRQDIRMMGKVLAVLPMNGRTMAMMPRSALVVLTRIRFLTLLI